jgi:ATP-dependent Clp endopeptidase proteolytic subunit ClpP
MPKELIEATKAKIEAETEHERYEGQRARASALAYELDLEKKRIEHERMLSGDFFHKTFYFDSDVNSKSVGFCMDQLDQWDRMNPGGTTIEIAITSPGGGVIDGLALFDHIQYLKRKGHVINTVALGVAASMGGILLQAGTRRIMTKESWLLIHEISGVMMGSYGEMEDRMEWVSRTQRRILEVFAKRAADSGAPNPITVKQLEKNWKRKDWWIDSDEALSLGLVDEVR